MTHLAVAQTACAISFVFMFASVGHLIWRSYREAKKEMSDPFVTRSEVYEIIRSELKPIVEDAISQALSAKNH
ncbi:MAG: hypothetical protein IJM68_02495 [Synergistaceae bacterium]|nr:hypothetical protein [Synergistaceae bacterium]MBQ6664435.1 hypothetical protein [Synergistaceae bacterium]MBR0185390.1 hypothetical protein [Synergistaceae bacterium]